MGRALQVIAGTVTAGGAGFNTVTAAAGDSFTVAASAQEGSIYLQQLWASGAVTDMLRVFSPRMHDQVNGIRVQVGTTKNRVLLPWGADQPLYPADTPTFQTDATGAGATGLLALYEYLDLGGASARLANWSDVRPRIEQVAGVEVDAAASATVGNWGTGVAINGTADNFKANRDYALLGFTTNVAVLGISVVGPDTSNYRIGAGGDPDPRATREVFVRMSEETGRPCIPIINANNRGSTQVQISDTAASTAAHVSLILGLLKQ